MQESGDRIQNSEKLNQFLLRSAQLGTDPPWHKATEDKKASKDTPSFYYYSSCKVLALSILRSYGRCGGRAKLRKERKSGDGGN